MSGGRDIRSLLSEMLETGASDLYITCGYPPAFRNEKMQKPEGDALNESEVKALIASIATPKELEEFNHRHELNLAYTDDKGNRYRINCFQQRQLSGMVIRHIKKRIPSFDELGLPKVYADAISHKRGLILIAGPAGSGKTTSMASMLDHLNNNSSGHIISVEDPIEYLHEHRGCIFTQREIGIDTESWDSGLKNALRQRPDIIAIGEIRDARTMMHAISYAETGHLCIATIHATSAVQTIDRVGNLFAPNLKDQYLYSLAHVLKYVFAQRMIAGIDGRKRVAVEVMANEGNIRQLIIKGHIPEISDLLQKNADIGAMTFDQSLLNLFDKGKITRETLVRESDHPQNMELELMKRSMRNSPAFKPRQGEVDY